MTSRRTTKDIADMPSSHPTLAQSYLERSYHPSLTPLAAYLLRLMHYKQTNLCLSADVTTTAELLKVADEVGDYICVLKTHADIISDFGDRTIRGLNEIAKRRKFLVFEDRKFGDIGNTVQLQYVGGPLTIVKWAPIVNAHIFPGPAIIPALAQAAQQAIAAYNSSVSTDISASPAPSVDGSVTESLDNEEPETNDAGNVSEEEGDIYGDQYEDNYDARFARKQSVVSVSTTISMKSEALSPAPHNGSHHQHRPSLSRVSTGESTNHDLHRRMSPRSPHTANFSVQQEQGYLSDQDLAAQHLADLGPPPYLRGLLLLAQMSSADNFFSAEYTAACLHHARQNRSFVFGFISQVALNSDPDDAFITMTPGVQLVAGGDGKGQQYNSPAKIIGENGADVVIVGRGILGASAGGPRAEKAREYRKVSWDAYLARVNAASGGGH